MIETFVILSVFPALIAFGGVSDLLTMTISNRLCLAIAALFPPVALLAGMPVEQILLHAAAALLVLLICFGLFASGLIGGGDAKFAAASALWLGFGALLPYLIISAVLGGLLTLVMLWMKANPVPSLALRMPWYADLQDPNKGVPYGVALSIGLLVTLPETLIWRLALVV